MLLSKRCTLAILMSFMSEGAIAQTPTQTPAPSPRAVIPEPWYTSKYGKDDTLGAVNNLTAQGVKDATKLVKTGKVYGLAVQTAPEGAAYGARTYKVERTPGPNANYTPQGGGSQRVTSFDEAVTTSMGVGTQIDGFGHLGVDHHYYNGATGQEIATSRKFQPADIPPIVTRGVLIDMTKQFNKPMLVVGDTYNKAEIMAAAKAQGISIRKGDVVLFHTGWMDKMYTDKNTYRSSEPGIGEEGAQYLADLGVVAIGSDTIALEALPSPPGKSFIVHQTLLAKNGVHILETVNTKELAKDGVNEFLFVLGIPRMVGTVQMVINPVAIH